MNEPTFPNPEYGSFDRGDWMRTLSDLPPAECMREVEHAKPAVHAVWRARTPDLNELERYGLRWHLEGWSPADWWRLAASLVIIDQTERERILETSRIKSIADRYPRELCFELSPYHWQEWHDLAETHGAFRATLAMLYSSERPSDAGLYWAKRDTATTEMGQGKPGEVISYDL